MITTAMNRPTIPLARKKILIVDDHAEIRQALSLALEIEGYIVQQAQDGQEALERVRESTPHLIISDIRMPNMDGIEFYKSLRQNPDWVAIPFIFLTASNSPEAIETGRKLGVEDYLIKPVDPYELTKIVNSRLLRALELQVAFIDQAYLETVNVLANTIEGRDPYTHGHVERVATYARWLGEALNWPEENMRILEFGSRLHDINCRRIRRPDHHAPLSPCPASFRGN
jgi:putative two-component system response regulator